MLHLIEILGHTGQQGSKNPPKYDPVPSERGDGHPQRLTLRSSTQGNKGRGGNFPVAQESSPREETPQSLSSPLTSQGENTGGADGSEEGTPASALDGEETPGEGGAISEISTALRSLHISEEQEKERLLEGSSQFGVERKSLSSWNKLFNMCNERRIQGSGVSDTISLAVQSSAVLDSKDFTVIPYSDTVGLLEQKARSALKMPRSARLWRVGHNNQREPLGKSEQTLEETSITDREVLFLEDTTEIQPFTEDPEVSAPSTFKC